jgi:peptide/nickel transport system ATP-binding protein
MNGNVVLEVRNLSKFFPVGGGLFASRRPRVHAVEDVTFTLAHGQILALVGESGSGKRTIARLIAGQYPASAGSILFHDQDVLKLHGRQELLRYRSRVQMVFQDPFGSLNPVKTIEHHIMRPILIHHQARNRRAAHERVLELLRTVGLVPP